MNVLSLFDGISCGQLALTQESFKINNYYASEIENSSIQVTLDNFPNTVQLGDVTKWREWDIDWASINLLIGGSPCQGFSICGNRLNFNDPRSALFQEYLDILNHIKSLNPDVKFMLENVKMDRVCQDEISRRLGVDPLFIDSSTHTAQMRKRLYWFNWDANQPQKEEINFQDIVTNGYVEKKKSWCLLESWNRFPVSMDSAKGRYKRSMMPIIFSSPCFDWDKGLREPNITECERLQSVSDGYTKSASSKIAKGLLGNGWNVKTVRHIFHALKQENSMQEFV